MRPEHRRPSRDAALTFAVLAIIFAGVSAPLRGSGWVASSVVALIVSVGLAIAALIAAIPFLRGW